MTDTGADISLGKLTVEALQNSAGVTYLHIYDRYEKGINGPNLLCLKGDELAVIRFLKPVTDLCGVEIQKA